MSHVVVGMGYDERDKGAVATASYEAREFGVESAMPIDEALELLPRERESEGAGENDGTGHYVPVDMESYKSVSEEVMAVLESFSDTLEPVGIDEAYLEVSGRVSWNGVEGFAGN